MFQETNAWVGNSGEECDQWWTQDSTNPIVRYCNITLHALFLFELQYDLFHFCPPCFVLDSFSTVSKTRDIGLVATVSKKRRMGSLTKIANNVSSSSNSSSPEEDVTLSLDVGKGQYISLSDPSSLQHLDVDMKDTARNQLKVLQDQMSKLMAQLGNQKISRGALPYIIPRLFGGLLDTICVSKYIRGVQQYHQSWAQSRHEKSNLKSFWFYLLHNQMCYELLYISSRCFAKNTLIGTTVITFHEIIKLRGTAENELCPDNEWRVCFLEDINLN